MMEGYGGSDSTGSLGTGLQDSSSRQSNAPTPSTGSKGSKAGSSRGLRAAKTGAAGSNTGPATPVIGEKEGLLLELRKDFEASEERLGERILNIERQTKQFCEAVEKLSRLEVKLEDVQARLPQSEQVLRGMTDELQSLAKRVDSSEASRMLDTYRRAEDSWKLRAEELGKELEAASALSTSSSPNKQFSSPSKNCGHDEPLAFRLSEKVQHLQTLFDSFLDNQSRYLRRLDLAETRLEMITEAGHTIPDHSMASMSPAAKHFFIGDDGSESRFASPQKANASSLDNSVQIDESELGISAASPEVLLSRPLSPVARDLVLSVEREAVEAFEAVEDVDQDDGLCTPRSRIPGVLLLEALRRKQERALAASAFLTVEQASGLVDQLRADMQRLEARTDEHEARFVLASMSNTQVDKMNAQFVDQKIAALEKKLLGPGDLLREVSSDSALVPAGTLQQKVGGLALRVHLQEQALQDVQRLLQSRPDQPKDSGPPGSLEAEVRALKDCISAAEVAVCSLAPRLVAAAATPSKSRSALLKAARALEAHTGSDPLPSIRCEEAEAPPESSAGALGVPSTGMFSFFAQGGSYWPFRPQ